MTRRLLSKANRNLEMLSRYGSCRKLWLIARVLVVQVHEQVEVRVLVVLHRMGVDFQAISLEVLADA